MLEISGICLCLFFPDGSILNKIADTPDCSCIRLNGLWLQAIEFKTLKVLLVIAVELRIIGHVGVHCNLLFVIMT